MGYSRKVYEVTEHKDCAKILHTFNSFAKNFNNICLDPYVDYRLIKKLPNDSMIHYSMEVYLDILQMLNDKTDKIYMEYFNSEKYGYKSRVYLHSTPPRHEFFPEKSVLSIIYEISDENNNRIFNIRFAPYVSRETCEFELNYGLRSNHPEIKPYTFNKIPEVIKPISDKYFCSTVNTCYITYYKLSNYFFPNGLDKNRRSYNKDLNNLREWSKKYPTYNMVFDDLGILVSRNKKFKLTELNDKLPTISSYVCYH